MSTPIPGKPVPPAIGALKHEVIAIFVGAADLLGIPKSVGEIYGLLYASAEPLAFQDIVDRLGLSKGSASPGLRLLRAAGAIKPVYVAGDRRDHFEPETELRHLMAGFLRERRQPHREHGAVRLDVLKKELHKANGRQGVAHQVLSDREAEFVAPEGKEFPAAADQVPRLTDPDRLHFLDRAIEKPPVENAYGITSGSDGAKLWAAPIAETPSAGSSVYV